VKSVEQFLHDERLESLAVGYDRAALAKATAATYVIHQDVTYEYTKPVSDLRQRLVIIPRRRHGDQQRIAHRFDVSSSGTNVVRHRTDRFGNSVLHVTTSAVESSIEFNARVVVSRSRTSDVHPSWSDTRPAVTPLTEADDALTQAADDLRATGAAFDMALAVGELVHRSFQYQHDVTSVRTTAAQAWSLRQGVCQDMAHVMIAMCATLGVAARYVSGHLVGDGASHAWVEVFDPRTRHVLAYDPTHGRSADLRYLTTATGRDYRDVAPTAGTYVSNGGRGHLTVRKKIRLADLS
jgi:transglutaminase-like putative cysteine protease